VAKVFAGNYVEVEYFDENNKESGGSVVHDVQLKTENTEIEDTSLVAV
jgi:hypothetical protein